jgi:hypothetical protein
MVELSVCSAVIAALLVMRLMEAIAPCVPASGVDGGDRRDMPDRGPATTKRHHAFGADIGCIDPSGSDDVSRPALPSH